ncbi:MAG: DMT family transporter, partial [Patescibacteria group bacterium]
MNNKHIAILALVIANIVWGATSPIMKWALADLQPFTMAFLRFFLAAFILLPFARKQLFIQKKDIFNLAIMALFGVSLSIGLFLLALTTTESINAPLIGSSTPIFVVIISIFFLHEKAKVRTIAGSILGLLGIIVILLNPILEKGLDSSLIGNLLLIASTLTGVVHLFISKKLRNTYSPITLTFYSFLFGSLFFVPLFIGDIVTSGIPTIGMQGFI